MKLETTYTILKNNEALTKEISNKLQRDGYISDEENIDINSYVLEKWNRSATSMIRKHGYTGGSLQCLGIFHPEVGEGYLLFDTKRIEDKKATALLEKIMQNNINKDF